MPGLEENLNAWDKSYEWTKAGNEWGGADAQWRMDSERTF